MEAKTLVPIEEYLRASYPDLDREYVDGEIVERSLPDNLHAEIQFRLCGIFFKLSERLPFHGHTGLRSRVAATRIRIADVSIYDGAEPQGDVPASAPLVAIEVLSPDDRHLSVLQRLEEYKEWGARHVWLVNPHTRQLHVYVDGSLRLVNQYEIPEYGVIISPEEIFG